VELPWVNAYVGGALDFAAVLQETTGVRPPLYCKDPRLLFDVPAIIDYIEAHRAQFLDKNAMQALLAYLREFGGCGAADQ